MMKLTGSFKILTASCCLALLIGCNEPTTQNTSGMQQTTVTTTTKDTTHVAPASPADIGLTLPVLDALFYEDDFGKELKEKLQLTDQQITQLKTVSHGSVADLSEDGSGDYTGSARGAVKRYQDQLDSILGTDKTQQLTQMVSQRYASGSVEGVMSSGPNAVPTDTRIVVNAPAYRMDVFENGQLTKSYRVGIGYPEFPLPTGMRRAENIVFNPTWTPPDEPWVKGKFKAGKKVEAGSKDNPLGPIKIPIGLPSLIHGGKSVTKLGSFASHGCVGMTNEQVQDFAVTLAGLSGSSITAEDVQDYATKKEETKSVKLGKAVPVELRYETIVAENGNLLVFRDVYERGTNTLETVQRVLAVYSVSYDSLSQQEKQSIQEALTAMNTDPQGNPIIPDINPDTSSNNRVAASKQEGAKKGKVTNHIVGRKEIVVPIAALQGKGYPAPVDLNSGKKVTGNTATSADGKK